MKSMDLFLILADYLEKSSKYKKTKLIIFLGNVMKSMDLFGIVKPVGDPLDIDVGLLIDDLSCWYLGFAFGFLFGGIWRFFFGCIVFTCLLVYILELMKIAV